MADGDEYSVAGQGAQAAGEYLSGYLIEKSLSVDNIFVWAVILDHFAVDHRHRHRVLFWGVFGALAMRGLFIAVGVSVIHRFEWVNVVFGAVLLWSALKILRSGDDDAIDPANSKVLRMVRRFVPSTDDYQVTATTIIENNTYTSAPIQVTGASGFLAQVMQDSLRGTYDFQMVAGPSTAADRMVFQKTTLGPVTFNIWKNGRIMQSVVVPDSFLTRSVQIGSVFTIYAVINGVTTALVTTGNPEATITAVTDTSDLEAGYFTLLAN